MNVFGGFFQFDEIIAEDKCQQQPRLYFEETFEEIITYSFKKINCIASSSSTAREGLNAEIIQKSSCGRYMLTGHFRLDYRDELGDKLGVRYEELKKTDDVVLAMMAFEKWGIDFVSRLEGDWAFILFDEVETQLFFFRDPIGAGAIFYYEHNGFLYFSSDPRMFNFEDFQLTIDLEQFFKLGLKSGKLDDGKTVIKGLSALKKGEVYRADQRLVLLKQYPLFATFPVLNFRDDEDYIALFKSTYAAAVRTRLGKGKNGLFLSAGLDSSMLCYFATRELLVCGGVLNTYTSFPKYIHLFSEDKQERIREDIPARKFVSQFSNVEPRFLDFSKMDMADMFKENEPFQLVRCLVKPNSFWIHGIFCEAQSDGVETMMVAKQSNYTVSWNAPKIGLHYLLNLNLKDLVNFFKPFSYKGNLQFLKAVKREIIAPLLSEFSLFFHRAEYLIKGFKRVAGICKTKYFHISGFEKWNLSTQFVPGFSSGANPRKFRLLILNTVIDQAGIFGILDSLKHGIRVVDPSSDSRLIAQSFTLPERFFYQDGKAKFIYRRIMNGLVDEKIIQKRVPFPQAYDIGLRLQESRGIKIIMQEVEKEATVNAFLKTDQVVSDMNSMKQWGIQTEGLLRAGTILRFISLKALLDKYH